MSALPGARRPPAEAPPRVDVGTGPTTGGIALRAGLLVAAAVLTGLALGPVVPAPGLRWALAVVAGGVVAWHCVPPVPHVLVVLAGLALAGTPGPFAPVALALVALAHVVLRLAWWAAHVPPTGRVELRALVPDARRLVVIQAGVQAAGLALLLVAGTAAPAFVVAVGGLALVALTLLVLPRD